MKKIANLLTKGALCACLTYSVFAFATAPAKAAATTACGGCETFTQEYVDYYCLGIYASYGGQLIFCNESYFLIICNNGLPIYEDCG